MLRLIFTRDCQTTIIWCSNSDPCCQPLSTRQPAYGNKQIITQYWSRSSRRFSTNPPICQATPSCTGLWNNSSRTLRRNRLSELILFWIYCEYYWIWISSFPNTICHKPSRPTTGLLGPFLRNLTSCSQVWPLIYLASGDKTAKTFELKEGKYESTNTLSYFDNFLYSCSTLVGGGFAVGCDKNIYILTEFGDPLKVLAGHEGAVCSLHSVDDNVIDATIEDSYLRLMGWHCHSLGSQKWSAPPSTYGAQVRSCSNFDWRQQLLNWELGRNP